MATQKERVHLELLATDNVSQPVDKAADSIRKFDREAQKANKQGLRLMRGGLGQVGHQIQDIAVQLQMGQNAMLVFGQQGSQIASLMGPNGALIGAVMAVGAALATAYAPSVIGAKDRTKELQEQLKTLSKVMSVDVADGTFELTERFRSLAAHSKELAEIQLGLNYVKALKTSKTAQDALSESTDEFIHTQYTAQQFLVGASNEVEAFMTLYQDMTKEQAAAEIATRNNAMALGKLATSLGLTAEETSRLQSASVDVKNGIEGSIPAFQSLINEILSANKGNKNLSDTFLETANKILETSVASAEASLQLQRLEELMGNLEGVLQTTSPEFETLVESQNNFKKSLEEQAETLGKSKEQILIYKAGLLGLADNQEVLDAIQAIINKQNELDMAQGVEKLQKRLMTRKEVLSAAFDEEMQLLTEFAAADVANEQLAAELKIKAQENYYNKLEELRQKSKKFEDKTATEKTQMVLNGLGDAFKGVQANNKKMFAAQKAYNIAQAIMSTYTGATKAIETYPPPISFAMAAAQVAAGMAQIAQIRAQSFDGGGFTGSGSRSGGMDGKGGFPAILHPNETVIDHTKGQSGGITIINNIDAKGADANVDMKIRAAMQQSSQQTVATIQDLMRRRRFV
jgi:hypothetical protein